MTVITETHHPFWRSPDEAGAACATVAAIGGEPVACAAKQGHGGPHGWAGLEGAPTGGAPPGRSGSARTAAARGSAYRTGSGACQASGADLCCERAKGVPIMCAHPPDHGGAHSWSKVVGKGRTTGGKA